VLATHESSNTDGLSSVHDGFPSLPWHCWLGVRKSIWPIKIEWRGVGVVICLERGADCLHMVQLMPLHPKSLSSLASFKSRLVIPFWYRLTHVVLEKRPLNGCSIVVVAVSTELWIVRKRLTGWNCILEQGWWCVCMYGVGVLSSSVQILQLWVICVLQYLTRLLSNRRRKRSSLTSVPSTNTVKRNGESTHKDATFRST